MTTAEVVGRAHALGAAAAAVAVEAAGERDDEAEDRCLGETREHVDRLQRRESVLQIVLPVEAEFQRADDVAAEHAEDIGHPPRAAAWR